MALREHCLDGVFGNDGGAEDLKAAFAADTRVQAAFAMAAAAYEEMKKAQEKHPGLCGPSPAQAALSAWLDVLDLRRDQDRDEK